MTHHAAYGLTVEALDIIVIDDSKSMQVILRSMLTGMNVQRVRCFDRVDEAISSAIAEPPNVFLTDWQMKPYNGFQFLRLLRQKRMMPLCLVPVLFVTAHGTMSVVQKAALAGAQHVVVKPVSPQALHARLRWLTTDSRPLELGGDGAFVIEGVKETIKRQIENRQRLYRGKQTVSSEMGLEHAPKPIVVHENDEVAPAPYVEPKQAFAPSKQAHRPRKLRNRSQRLRATAGI